MAIAHFFSSYLLTRGLSLFNSYIKNIELKSLFHSRSRNNTGKPSKPSDHSEVPKQYGQTIKTLRSFRGPETIRANHQNPQIIPRSRSNTGKTIIPRSRSNTGKTSKPLFHSRSRNGYPKPRHSFYFSLSGFFIDLTRPGK